MRTTQQEIEERTKLAGNNKFELLLFRLGEAPHLAQRELFGINVFKVREVLVMPPITALANAHEHLMGVANIRGQIIPVINLPAVVGCTPKKGHTILMVTEFGRTVQAFAVEDVREIVRLDWDQVLPAESSHAGALITGIARLDGATANTRLAQVLDVEQILKTVMPVTTEEISKEVVGPRVELPPGHVILVADDSPVARTVIELGLKAMGVPYLMTKTGKEAWERLQAMSDEAEAEGKTIYDRVSVVLTDLEMPEMDGFTLTRHIKLNPKFKALPVVIHSSLTGTTNENHVKKVGADGYVAKFSPRDLANTIRSVLPGHAQWLPLPLAMRNSKLLATSCTRPLASRTTSQKKSLIQSRLTPRIQKLGLDGFADYIAILQDERQAAEFQMAVDLLTTNETYFFREPKHYQLLESELASRKAKEPLTIWSAASSFGDEAYSTAMLLSDMQISGKIGPEWSILGTDISHRVLLSAKEGVYPQDRLRDVSAERLRRYCLKGEGDFEGQSMVNEKIRARVNFGQLNLCKPFEGLGPFDVVFLRNVLIYFDAPTKRDVVDRVLETLKPGGLFFLGTAEGRAQCDTPLITLQPGAFRKAA